MASADGRAPVTSAVVPHPRLADPRTQLVLLAGLALAIRLVAISTWSSDLGVAGDQVFYHEQGQDLAAGHGFTYRHPAGERITTAVHPPLHGAVLGASSAVGLDGVTAHRVVGAVLGATTALVAGLAGLRMAGRRVGLVAAGAVAVLPTLWINDSQVLSESSFALATALVVLASFELVRRPRPMVAAALGGAIGLATMARAEAAMLAVLLAVPLVVLVVRRHRRDGRAAPPWMVLAGAVAIGGVLVAGPWVGRNLTSFDRPALVSTGAGFVLEIASCDETFHGELVGYWSASCDRTSWEPGDETATEAAKRATGLAYVRDNLDRVPAVAVARVGRMWDLWRPDQSVTLNRYFERRGEASSWWAIRAWWAAATLAMVGGWSLRRRPELLVPFVAIAATTTVAAAMSFGITRYRTGLEVAAAVLAAVGVDAIVRWSRRRAPDPEATAAPAGSAT